MKDGTRSAGAVALVTGGIGAAFALAACCALPMLLMGAGLGVYWLGPIARFGERFNVALTAIAVLALAGAIAIVLRTATTCRPVALCARPWFRVGIVALAGVGAVLLVLAKSYA